MANDIDRWVQLIFGVDPAKFPSTPASQDGDVAVLDAKEPETVKGLGPLPISPSDIPDPRKHCVVNGKLHNKSSKALKLASAKATSGDITEDPPQQVDPKAEDDEFRAESAFPDLFKGAVGRIEYLVGDDGTKWTLTWSIPQAININEHNLGTSTVTGPSADKLTAKVRFGPGKEADYVYVLEEKGGGGTDPNKPDGPGAQTNASCLVTVINKTAVALALAHQGHDHGDFMTFPANEVAAGATISFASVQTPQSKEKGCKGFVVWDVGSPSAGTWRIEWDNPVAEKNTATATIDPASAGFKSVEQIGQGDENVPAAFTLSGGPSGPNPQPQPNQPDPPFEPPAKPGQPTLRKGDKTPDGWVEYAQQLLNFHLKAGLAIDGDFGNGTLAAVKKFQAAKKLTFDDGIIGNETWAALREGAPEKPATDGRKPHSFEEKGKQGRFTTEKPHNCQFHTAANELGMRIVSVGEQDIEGNLVTVRVTQPDGTKKVQQAPIGGVDGPTPDGQGQLHRVVFAKFTERFAIKDPATVGACLVEAYLAKEIGGDTFSGNPQVEA